METTTTEAGFARMRRLAPEVTGGLLRMRQKAYSDGAVPAKYKIMAALAISVAIRCEPCIRAYVTKLKEECGVRQEEIVEILEVAMVMQGCPGEEWAIKALTAWEAQEGDTDPLDAGGDKCCTVG